MVIWCQTYGKGQERKPAATTTCATVLLVVRDVLYAPFHRQDSTYHGLFKPVMEHWLESETAQSKDPSHP